MQTHNTAAHFAASLLRAIPGAGDRPIKFVVVQHLQFVVTSMTQMFGLYVILSMFQQC